MADGIPPSDPFSILSGPRRRAHRAQQRLPLSCPYLARHEEELYLENDESGSDDEGLNLHPGPRTVISHGTDGLDSIVQSVMMQCMRQVVDVDDLGKIFDNFNLGHVLMNNTSYSNQLNQITSNVCFEFQQHLPLLMANLHLSVKELEVYCVPIFWSSTQRVGFAGHLSDRLFSKAKVPDQQDDLEEDLLLKELESMRSLIFNEPWTKKIHEWLNKVETRFRPHESDYESVGGLFRFLRNRWHHSDEFQESHRLRNAQSFYNYFDRLFPNLLILSYGAAYRLCREEPWFKDYLPPETI